MAEKIKFKLGSYFLNNQVNFNFQLNRVIMWDGGRLEDLEPIANAINNSEDWKKHMIALGDTALKENRIKNAIAYYRMSEFFMYDGDPDKIKYYQLATEMFYEYYKEYFSGGLVTRWNVPFDGVHLPVMHVCPKDTSKGTILLHGGNDSYYEELFLPMLYCLENGFEVYLFEGPGQGGVTRLQNKSFTYQWEAPVKAVLDTFCINDVTIVGASLGGMLAPRAAAFDKRIQRVVCWSVFPSFLDTALFSIPRAMRRLVRQMLRLNIRYPINLIINKKMKEDQTVHWAVHHGMYAYEANTPYEWLKKINNYQIYDIGDKITQDVLILAASNDHFIPTELYKKEIDAFTNAKSITYRRFTAKEYGEAHCNVGNTKLVFDTIFSWITQMHDKNGVIELSYKA